MDDLDHLPRPCRCEVASNAEDCRKPPEPTPPVETSYAQCCMASPLSTDKPYAHQNPRADGDVTAVIAWCLDKSMLDEEVRMGCIAILVGAQHVHRC